MKGRKTLGITITIVSFFMIAVVCFAAYHHMGEDDTGIFLTVYPDKAGTKLDSCNLCHKGGQTGGKNYGSCQWCHRTEVYGYTEPHGNIDNTLNSFGLAYKANGSSIAAIQAIASLDSDGDGYSNAAEIAANRYPGDPNDDPSKISAPYKVFTKAQLEKMPQHTQFMLMNTHKSNDFYAEYTGVPMEQLLKKIILPSAEEIIVFSPDGFFQFHPLNPDPNPIFYHVFGDYVPAIFYYNEQADIAANPTSGWCDYSAPSVAGKVHGETINNTKGLKMLLAIKRDGEYLTPGVLNSSNKLDGEGPYRIVPPQKIPGPPDQKSTAPNAKDPTAWIWPMDDNADHSAGFSARSATMIAVLPLPEGTTDIDTMEAGWPYIDAEKIVVYGAINPVPNVLEKLVQLHETIDNAPKSAFKNSCANKVALKLKVDVVWWLVKKGHYYEALKKLENDIVQKMNGCSQPTCKADKNDWVKDCEFQKQLYWLANEIVVLLKIVA